MLEIDIKGFHHFPSNSKFLTTKSHKLLRLQFQATNINKQSSETKDMYRWLKHQTQITPYSTIIDRKKTENESIRRELKITNNNAESKFSNFNSMNLNSFTYQIAIKKINYTHKSRQIKFIQKRNESNNTNNSTKSKSGINLNNFHIQKIRMNKLIKREDKKLNIPFSSKS